MLPDTPIICSELSEAGGPMVQCKRWVVANQGHFHLNAVGGGPGTTPCNQKQTNLN